MKFLLGVVLILVVVLLGVEGYFVYRFYAAPAPSAVTEAAATHDGTTTAASATTAAPPSDDAATTGPPETPSLQRNMEECTGGQEECVREIVAEIAPKAEYAGGRIDTDESGRSRTVLYFENPAMGSCEYARLEHVGGEASTDYVAIIAGEGSYEEEVESDCVPEL